ncbi:hypothetical protein [Streptomyces sp. NPDC057302]|uniref:hypothetical protein n=1 Tax=Streptomyces sp. NPDC057302 TaxID=3346094 RepID=UPI00363662A0
MSVARRANRGWPDGAAAGASPVVRSTGASLRELMARMGHSTARAALIYQHVVNGRDREIANRLGEMIRKDRETSNSGDDLSGEWHVSGTGRIMQKGQPRGEHPLSWPFSLCPRQDSNLRHPL